MIYFTLRKCAISAPCLLCLAGARPASYTQFQPQNYINTSTVPVISRREPLSGRSRSVVLKLGLHRWHSSWAWEDQPEPDLVINHMRSASFSLVTLSKPKSKTTLSYPAVDNIIFESPKLPWPVPDEGCRGGKWICILLYAFFLNILYNKRSLSSLALSYKPY